MWYGSIASFAELQCNIAKLITAWPNHPARAESNKSAWCGILYVCHTMGTVFCAELGSDRVRRLRAKNWTMGGRCCDVARICQFNG